VAKHVGFGVECGDEHGLFTIDHDDGVIEHNRLAPAATAGSKSAFVTPLRWSIDCDHIK